MASTISHKLCAALIAGVSSVACTHVPLRSPAQGGNPWTELTSQHLVLSTDIDVERARDMLTEFERMYEALGSQIPHPAVDPAGRIDLVVFDDRRDFVALSDERKSIGAYFQSHPAGDLEAHPVMVMTEGVLASGNMSTFLHELTHRFVREDIPRVPTWLNEGLAQYFETLLIEDGHLLVGEPISGVGFTAATAWSKELRTTDSSRYLQLQTQIPVTQAPSVQQLFDADPETFYAARHDGEVSEDDKHRQTAFYAGAWKLVHLLMNGPNRDAVARFKTFLNAASNGTETKEAFEKAFGADALPGLQKAYEDYLLTSGDVWKNKYALPPAVPPERERAMSDAEILVLWARLRPWKPTTMDAVKRDLDAAVAADPKSPEPLFRRAILALYQERHDDARRDLTAALASRPADPRFLLAQIVVEQSQNDSVPSALVDRLAAAAVSAAQLDLVARCRTKSSPDEAMEFAKRSVATDSTCASCQDTLSSLLAGKGMYEEALAANERASALLPEGVSGAALAKKHQILKSAADAARAKRSSPP